MSQKQLKVAEIDRIIPGQMLRVIAEDKAIPLANIEGRYYAIDDQCSHEDASLYNGALKGDCVECPLHGSHFSFKTGEPQQKPATEAITTYEVVEKIDGIYISL